MYGSADMSQRASYASPLVRWVVVNAVGWAFISTAEIVSSYLWFLLIPIFAISFGFVQWLAVRRIASWAHVWVAATAVGWVVGEVVSFVAGAVLVQPATSGEDSHLLLAHRLYDGALYGVCIWGCVGCAQWIFALRIRSDVRRGPGYRWVVASSLAGGLAGVVGVAVVWLMFGEAPTSFLAASIDGFSEGGVYGCLTFLALRTVL
jgi:hypothetical protein